MRTRYVALDNRASSSVQRPAYGQEPHCCVAKDTAHVDMSGRTHSWSCESQQFPSHAPNAPVLTLVACGRSVHFQSQTEVSGTASAPPGGLQSPELKVAVFWFEFHPGLSVGLSSRLFVAPSVSLASVYVWERVCLSAVESQV